MNKSNTLNKVMPKISVIIPCYNGSKYLHVVYQCLKQQTFEDFEAIFIDDGSTDDSGIIIDSFAKSDSRVNVIHQKNSGVSAARNAGLQIAKGEYICFIDCDDKVENDYLEKLYSKTYDGKTDVVIGMFRVVNLSGGGIPIISAVLMIFVIKLPV